MIYFDNAASSLQKPEEVIEAVNDCLLNYSANPGRSGHKLALRASSVVYDTRAALAEIFGISDPFRVIFTSGATESINLAVKGSLKKGDHVVTTSMEHNSVIRPLSRLKGEGVEVSVVDCSYDGSINPADIEKEIKPNTKMVICTHVSNVTGTIMPVSEIGEICKKHNILFLVDAAQSAGGIDIDVNKMSIDLLVVSGHKYLMGLQGTGLLYISENADVTPLMEGGTGSSSEQTVQPLLLPDRYESGTLNLPGIAALGASVSFIESVGLSNIREHEEKLTKIFLEGLKSIGGVTVYGHTGPSTAVVAINLNGISSSELAFILDDEYDICTRAGLHCAPLAHKTIGTLDSAAVRFSFSFFNTEDEITKCLSVIKEISERI